MPLSNQLSQPTMRRFEIVRVALLAAAAIQAACVLVARLTVGDELGGPWGGMSFATALVQLLIVGGVAVSVDRRAAAPSETRRLPRVLLWIGAVLLAEDWTLLTATLGEFVTGLLGLALMTAIWTGIGTLLSAVCSSANLAMVLWAMLVVGSSAVGFVLSRALREPELRSALSFWDAGRVVVRDLASMPQRDVSVFGAYAMLATVAGALLLLARRRLRVVEALQ